MKTSIMIKTEKTFVEQMREIRDKVNLEIKDLSSTELKQYLDKQKTLHPIGFWKQIQVNSISIGRPERILLDGPILYFAILQLSRQ